MVEVNELIYCMLASHYNEEDGAVNEISLDVEVALTAKGFEVSLCESPEVCLVFKSCNFNMVAKSGASVICQVEVED